MKQRILGFDPGLAILGYGVLEYDAQSSETPALLDFGTIQTDRNLALPTRLCVIFDDLHTLLQTYQPDLVAIEKLFFYRMGNTILVAQARGILLLVLGQHQVPFLEFTPAQIKQALTGYGNANKNDVQQAVARELNLTQIPKPDDAADAIAVALTAWFQK